MSERITMKGVAECCEMFRANLVPMSPNKFWSNVACGEYDGWVVPREDTKRRQATIYIDGFIEYMHRRVGHQEHHRLDGSRATVYL